MRTFRRLRRLVVFALAVYGAVTLWQQRGRDIVEKWNATRGRAPESGGGRVGQDTATGTDPYAKYARPGYEDKSFGQAVKADQALADRLVREERGDLGRAAQRFDEEATGAPAIARQRQAGR
jgi:hypothetical protein